MNTVENPDIKVEPLGIDQKVDTDVDSKFDNDNETVAESGADLNNHDSDTNNNNNSNQGDDTRDEFNHDNGDSSNSFTENSNEKTNLIVNYLPQHMTDSVFEDLFKKFGPMKSCKIVRNRLTGYSYGFGFVDFETHDQAIKAIDSLNGFEIDKKKIKVAFARPAGQDIKQANLYIKHIPDNWTEDDVRKAFESFGKIIQVRVLGDNRGVAFVLYDLRKQAEDALQALNGKTYEGCEQPFEIKFAADKKIDKGNIKSNGPRRERGNRGGSGRNRQNRSDSKQGHSSHQRNLYDRGGGNSMTYGGGNFNNNNMDGIGPVRQQSANRMNRYSPFVPVQQAMGSMMPVTSAPMAQVPGSAYGYPAQQAYNTIPYMLPAQTMMSSAAAPMNQMAGQAMPMSSYANTAQMPIGYAAPTQIAQQNMYSMASHTMNNAASMYPQLGQPMRSSTTGSHGAGGSGGSDADGVTLFVYNIGPDTDESDLKSMFAPYGQVVKCNVVRKTPGGETKGFGFVTMQDRNQANAAISGLNGSSNNGRTLQVSLKK